MRFRDLPKFTKRPNWVVDVSWRYLEQQIAHFDESHSLEMDPPFQRAHVWTTDQQKAYVEFCLKGGESGRDIYWNCAGWMGSARDWYKNPIYLVDGKQRLEAVRKFLRDELRVFDKHMPYNYPIGINYSEFEDNLSYTDASFKFHMNDLMTYAEVLKWYLEFNSGGTPHTEDELNKVRIMLAAESREDREKINERIL